MVARHAGRCGCEVKYGLDEFREWTHRVSGAARERVFVVPPASTGFDVQRNSAGSIIGALCGEKITKPRSNLIFRRPREAMKKLLICIILCAATSAAFSQGNTSLAFVTEFVRELGATERIRTLGERELKEKNANPITASIRNSTRVQLELRSSIGMLSGMHLKPPAASIPEIIIDLYKKKIDFHQDSIDIASQFLAGPKPGVDYGKLGAEMPKITALLEYLDETLFKATPAVFGALIDMKADSQGHANHLVITKTERQKLVQSLKDSFGSKLSAKNQNYTVSAASVLLSYLQKDFKCSDEPW